jgi:type IV pilus assembly protein PilY1
MLTFDDSGSMRWAYAPDDICGDHATRRAKSADFNPLYYNPNVRYDPPLSYNAATGTYTEYTTSFTAAKINGFYAAHGTVDLSTNYRPTWAKNPAVATQSESAGDPSCANATERLKNNFARNPTPDFTDAERFIGVPAYYYVYDTTLAACTSPSLTNDNCYRRVFVTATSGPATVDLNGDGVINAADADERQNFANWYSFYRTRNLMTVTAATRAMVGVPATARVGWQSLSTCNGTTTTGTSQGLLFTNACSGWDGVNYDKRLKVFDGTHRANLLDWLARLPANGGTPLRQATSRVGEFFRSNGVNSPYALNPTVAVGTEYACRPNFHILMTDGMWNGAAGTCSGAACGNRDNAALTLPDGTAYSPQPPYRDSNSESLADVAFHYWATDLRPDLPNKLMPYRADRTGSAAAQYWNPKNDPATWQHVVMFTVGLGLGRIFTAPGIPWGGSTYAGPGYASLVDGTASWPATGADFTPGNVYDLWHAALNSRGQSFSADTPRDLSDALATALNRILERESAAAALATNSTRLATDSMLFQARFFSGTWSGSLTAFSMVDGAVGPVVWEATAPGKIPAHGARSIYTWNGVAHAGTTFTEAGLTAAGLWPSIGSTALLDYLRGDTSNESPNGLSFRARGGPLGDIVNSDPVFVATENYGYAALAGEGSSYAGYLAAKKTRLKMLYVGGNDGFLRGFNANTGQEVFAYVPNAVVPDMPLLANSAYAHRFYVDGSPAAWDAYFGGAWRTVLTGTTGAGGRSVFALDVTNPASFGASNVLWEVNQNTPMRAGDAADPQYGARLGYTLGQAVVLKLNNGEWAAVFGNGYRSPGNASAGIPADQASLYIVRVSDGTLIRRIDTGVGSPGAPNGLGTPTAFDSNGDLIADVVYAPDMRGNVWKFDLSGSNPAAWSLAFAADASAGYPNGRPLFRAVSGSGQVQPISARVELASPPPGKSGIMVLFGTGRFFAVGDNVDTTSQTFYGIWDNGTAITATDRSVLQAQTITTKTITLRGVPTTVRDVSTNTIDWATKRGWYLDLPTSMERVVGTAAVRDNRVIFTTLIPSVDPCDFGGSGWLMEVSAATGAQLPYAVFDTSGDGLVTSADSIIAGVPITVGMVKRPLVIDGTPVAYKLLSGTTGEIQVERNRSFGPPLGRESWREVR